MKWQKLHGSLVAYWDRGTVQVTKLPTRDRETASWRFDVYEGGRKIETGFTFTQASAKHAAEVHIPATTST